MDQDLRDGLLTVRNFLLRFRTGTIIGMILVLGLAVYNDINPTDSITEPIGAWVLAILYSRSQTPICGSRLIVQARLRGIPALERDPNFWEELRNCIKFAWSRRGRLTDQLRRHRAFKRPTFRGLLIFLRVLIAFIVLIGGITTVVYVFVRFKVAGSLSPWSLLLELPAYLIAMSLVIIRAKRAFTVTEQIANAPAQLELQLFSDGDVISDEQLAEEVLTLVKLNRRVASRDRNALIEARAWLTRELVNEVSDRTAMAGISATWWSGFAFFVIGYLLSFLLK
jgi:hypothetical protein